MTVLNLERSTRPAPAPAFSLTYAEALVVIGGLSHPEKMPWWAWSISATTCITGQKLALRENTICSSCYALKGRYLFPNVGMAHARRHAASEDPRFVDAFVIVLTNLFAKTRKRRADGRIENRFRWFDSGDLQSIEMLDHINQIALRTPFVDHWLPTREAGIVADYSKEFAHNLTVRMSTPLVGVGPKNRTRGLPVATVGCLPAEGTHDCRALAEQGNRCLDCDQCWTAGQDVNYPLH